jgi:hypothetical protein
MRAVIILSVMIFGMLSCTASRHTDSARATRRALEAEKTRMAVESIVQSGNYLIKMDKMYTGMFSNVHLAPESNFLILDEGKLRMKLGYLGRQYSFRGIAAINLSTTTRSYEVERIGEKGRYDVKIEASQAGEPFDINISIDDRGYCTVVVTNPHIETARYNGMLFIPTEKQGS